MGARGEVRRELRSDNERLDLGVFCVRGKSCFSFWGCQGDGSVQSMPTAWLWLCWIQQRWPGHCVLRAVCFLIPTFLQKEGNK